MTDSYHLDLEVYDRVNFAAQTIATLFEHALDEG